MLRTSAIQAMKILAAETFRLGKVSFGGFEDIDDTTINKTIELIHDNASSVSTETCDHLDIWADLSIAYEGNPPDSYRVLNSMIMDWVDDHDNELKKVINPALISYLKDKHGNIDISDLNESFDDYIWEDQVDFYPDIDESNNKIDFSLEMVLEIQDQEDNEGEEEVKPVEQVVEKNEK